MHRGTGAMEMRRRSNREGSTAGEMAQLVPTMVPQHSKKSNSVEDIFFSIPCTEVPSLSTKIVKQVFNFKQINEQPQWERENHKVAQKVHQCLS